MKPLGSRKAKGLLLGLAAGLVGLLLFWFGLFSDWENVTWDWRVRLLARPAPATAGIALIVLDQASLDWAKEELSLTWPWPRQVYAPLIELARDQKARVLALDVIFTEPSAIEGDDRLLADSFGLGLPVVASVVLGSGGGGVESWPPELAAKLPPSEGAAGWLESAAPETRADRVVLPIPELSAKANSLGNVGEIPDDDQVVRRAGLVRIFDGRPVPSLALSAYLAATGEGFRLEPGRLILGGRSIPLDSRGRAILNYRGGPGTHAKYSAAGVIQSALLLKEGKPAQLPSDAFTDRFLFFGFTAPGLHDLRASPLSAVHPGVAIQATVLDNLIQNDFIRPAPGWAAGAAVLFLGLLSGFLVVTAQGHRQTVMAFALFLPLPVVAGLAAYRLGMWWPVVGPEAAVALGLMGGVYLNYVTEGRQRRFIKTAFRHYLSPEVIEQILKDPGSLKLGGQRRELTILFSDLEGFTSISEGLDPAELTLLLNDYLSDMTEIILDEGGTLDKYEGDAIIAFWNAPLDQPDHAKRAVRAALGCQAALARRRAEFKERTGARAAGPDRPPQRPGGGGQHGLSPPLRLYRSGRRGQPGLAPGGGQQGLRNLHHGLGGDLEPAGGGVFGAGSWGPSWWWGARPRSGSSSPLGPGRASGRGGGLRPARDHGPGVGDVPPGRLGRGRWRCSSRLRRPIRRPGNIWTAARELV